MFDPTPVVQKARERVRTVRASETKSAITELGTMLETAEAEHEAKHSAVRRLKKRLTLAQTGRPAPDDSPNEAHLVRSLREQLDTLSRECVSASKCVSAITNMIDDLEKGKVSL